MKASRTLGIGLFIVLALASASFSQKWQPLKHKAPVPMGAILLLTDGTVLAHQEQQNAQNWYKLTPDASGSYVNGTWTKIASMPTINGKLYGPIFFGSVILPDGRMVVEGGEDLCTPGCQAVWTNLGAIYDPVKNKWTAVPPPAGWGSIGDAQSVILNDGTYMQANCCNTQQATFNPKTLGWTNIVGTGKVDRFDEEGWTLLPNGEVLTVDALSAPNSEIYNPKTKKWTSAGSTIVRLEDPSTQEIGPAVLRPDGTVYATGANTAGAGHTAIYNTKTKKWVKGPDFTGNLDAADAPAALEVNGNVIVMTSPGYGGTGAVFFEWDGTKLTTIAGPPNSAGDSSFYGHFLELPTGQLLFADLSNDVEVFTPKGTFNKAWAPAITSVPASVTRGKSYVVKGTQFSGMSGGAAYGDDFQDNSNYALVRITNNATKHVFYAKTTNPNSYAVQPGKLAESTTFTVAAKTETGASTLVVVTNGIPSAGKSVTVQ